MKNEDYAKHGFQTGNILLPGLNLKVNLPYNMHFRNDGIVHNLEEHTANLVKELNLKETCEFNEDDAGTCLTISSFASYNQASVIYFLKGTELGDLFRQGHESTHVVENMNLKQPFLDMLRREDILLNPFEEFSDPELIANFGGLMAIYNKSKKSFFDNMQNFCVEEKNDKISWLFQLFGYSRNPSYTPQKYRYF